MIIQDPAPILHKECQTTTAKYGKELGQKLIKAHDDYQAEHPEVHVVGMAAPQVGEAKRLFYAFGELFINPFIQRHSTKTQKCIEGCCSLEGRYQTERYYEVTLTWLDTSRGLRYHTFDGNQACIVQHELDHLKGKLISDTGVLQKEPSNANSAII